MNRVLPLLLLCACADRRPIETPPDSLVGEGEPFEATPFATSTSEAESLPKIEAASRVTVLPEGKTSVSEVRLVVLELDVSGARNGAELTLDLLAASDLLYERRTTTLTQGPDARQTSRFELPVAGTMIDLSRLHGRWEARFSLDGELLAARTFELTP